MKTLFVEVRGVSMRLSAATARGLISAEQLKVLSRPTELEAARARGEFRDFDDDALREVERRARAARGMYPDGGAA